MSNPSSDSFRNVTRYTGQDYSFAPRYIRPRDPHSPTNASNDIKPKEQQGHYPTGSFWTNSTNGNLWALQKITNNLANWILLSSGSSGPLLSIAVPLGVSPIVPDTTGLVTFTSTGGTVSITGSTANPNNHFINFDVTGGGTVLETITTDDPTVVAPVANNINLLGATVVNATHAKPVFTHSTANPTVNIDVQLGTTSTSVAKNINKSGLAHFDSAIFTDDAATGFVSLVGGSIPPAQSYTVDVAVAPGVNPVVPSATGNVIVTGGTNIETDTFAVNSITITSKAPTIIGASNIGIAYSAGTFTVQGSNGTALSTSNPAYVTMQNGATPGRLITIKVTANQTFTDAAGSGNITGNSWGTSSGAWANDMPYYLYAVQKSDQTAISFGISRVPNIVVAPVAGLLAITGSAVATTQGSMFLMGSPTVANYASQPVVCLGSFRMQKASVHNWIVQTLVTSDGIGEYQENTAFTYPQAQNGATSTTHFTNGSSAGFPVFANKGAIYTINRIGYVNYALLYTSLTTAGTNATAMVGTVPLGAGLAQNMGGYYSPADNVALNYTFGISLNPTSYTITYQPSALATGLKQSDINGANSATAQFGHTITYPTSIA